MNHKNHQLVENTNIIIIYVRDQDVSKTISIQSLWWQTLII